MSRLGLTFAACLIGASASLAASTHYVGPDAVGAQDARRLARTPGRARRGDSAPGSQRRTPLQQGAARPEGDSRSRSTGRVVSASLLSDELLQGILPWRRWAGVSNVVDWPAASATSESFPKNIPRTAAATEDLLSRGADLIVFSAYNNALSIAQLENLGRETYVVPTARNYEELFSNWRNLAARVGCEATARKRIERAERRLTQIRHEALQLGRRRRALLLQGMFSYGPESLQGQCLWEAGFANALSGSRGGSTPELNAEHLLALDPEVLFVASDVPAPRRGAADSLPGGSLFRALKAVRRGRTFLVPGSWMASISHHSLRACEAYLQAARLLDAAEGARP